MAACRSIARARARACVGVRVSKRNTGKYAIESCRIDLIPSVALERLGLHNELCSLKWKDPTAWQRNGFPLASRIDSLKRHFESVHAR
jgi:hypothetical protein